MQSIEPQFLCFQFVDVARLFRYAFDEAIENKGLSVTSGEARTLVYISNMGGCRQSVLATRMGIEPMSVSAFIDRLAANGLVSRTPDALDRRAKLVNVTAEGNSLLRQIDGIVSALHDKAIAGVSDSQIKSLHSTLAIIRANMMDYGSTPRL